MMVQYDDETLQAINDNVDLLAYVSQQIDMRQRGRDYFGRCPFHQERTPSFSITPETNKFYCFGCGAGGGIIQYLMQAENLDFNSAVSKASHLANIDLNTMCRSQTVMFNRSLKQHKQKQPHKTQHTILPYSEYAKYDKGIITSWLSEGIRQEEIDLFDIRLDRRSKRIVYPVYDTKDNLINIKGRTMLDNYKSLGIEKYINYYPVGTVDYFQGLTVTLPYIEQSGEIIIFEGLKSVMKLFGFGIRNSVSAEKHTLTTEQIQIIIHNPHINSVVLAYDSDVSYTRRTFDGKPNRKVYENMCMLKRFINLYVIEDRHNLLGGVEAKNSPVDLGLDIWNELYRNKRKVT